MTTPQPLARALTSPPPWALQPADSAAEVAARIAAIRAKTPDWLALPEDTVTAAVSEFTYAQAVERARENGLRAQCFPPFAKGTNLDVVASYKGLTRIGGESDERLFLRFLAVATDEAPGTDGYIESACYRASPLVIDARTNAVPPNRWDWRVFLRSSETPETGQPPGMPTDALITTVARYLTEPGTAIARRTVKPAWARYLVQKPTITPYRVEVVVTFDSRIVAQSIVEAAAREKLYEVVTASYGLGISVWQSAFVQQGRVQGAYDVDVIRPVSDLIAVDVGQAYYCPADATNVTITMRDLKP